MAVQKVSIRDLSEISGVSIPNIRIWERRYNVFRPKRTSTNIRIYSLEDLDKVVLIKYLLDSGFRIGKISNLSMMSLRKLVVKELIEDSYYHSELKKMISFIIEDQISEFDSFMEFKLSDISPEDFILNSLVPFLHLLKVLERVEPNKHYIGNLVRNKIIQRLIISADINFRSTSKNMEILIVQLDKSFTPVNLSMVNFLSTFKRYKTLFIMNAMEMQSIESMKSRIIPDFVYTEFNENQTVEEIKSQLAVFEKSFPLARIIVSGKQMNKLWREIPNKIYHSKSLEAFSKSL